MAEHQIPRSLPSWKDRIEAHPDQWQVLSELRRKLRKSKADYQVDPGLILELENYLKEVPLLPKHISALKPALVRKAQGILAELDAQQTRVAAVQFSAAKMLQVLVRLDIVVRNVLLESRVVSDKSTKPQISAMVALACPVLAQYTQAWEGLERLSALVATRLSDSKDSLKLQIKLDDNARWANKGGPA